MSLRKLIAWVPLVVLGLGLGLGLAGCDDSNPAPANAQAHSATVTWNASTSQVSGYHVYRATDPDAQPGLLAVTPADATQYVDKTVEPGRTYYYSVKSVGLDGAESEFSTKISATIPAN